MVVVAAGCGRLECCVAAGCGRVLVSKESVLVSFDTCSSDSCGQSARARCTARQRVSRRCVYGLQQWRAG